MVQFCGSIVIPVLNESKTIHAVLEDVIEKAHQLNQNASGKHWKIIVVDGGSVDDTQRIVAELPVMLISSAKGRAVQMNAGALQAQGDTLVFLHADTRLPHQFHQAMLAFQCSGKAWGRFDIQLDHEHRLLKMVSWFINKRSRFTSIATGDQAIFIQTREFKRLGGFPEIPLMEDVAFSKRARKLGEPYCIKTPVVTSSRRWLNNGIVKTILQMWWLRLAFFMGVSPARIHRWYYPNHYE